MLPNGQGLDALEAWKGPYRSRTCVVDVPRVKSVNNTSNTLHVTKSYVMKDSKK